MVRFQLNFPETQKFIKFQFFLKFGFNKKKDFFKKQHHPLLYKIFAWCSIVFLSSSSSKNIEALKELFIEK